MTQRDSQKSRLYKAEHGVFPWGQTIPDAELQVWLERKVLARAWFRRRFGNRYPTVWLSSGSGGYAQRDSIRVGRQARNPHVMLHELAHTLVWDVTSHGPEFAGVYLKLVRRVMGKESADILRNSYKANRVKYNMKCWPKPQVDLKGLPKRPRKLHTPRRWSQRWD